MNLKNLKNVKFRMTPQIQVESQIASTFGIMIAVIGSFIYAVFFVDWAWYFKLTSTIGALSIMFYQIIALVQLFAQRKEIINNNITMNNVIKNYIETNAKEN